MEFGPQEHLRRQVYALTTTRYAGLYLGLVTVLEWPKSDFDEDSDALRVYQATSRDGVAWDLGWIYQGERLVRDTKDRCHLPAAQLVTTETEHRLYYESCPSPHERRKAVPCTIDLVSYQLDGLAFLAVEQGSIWGEVTTWPFEVASNASRLVLNAAPEPGNPKSYTVQGGFLDAAKSSYLDGFRLQDSLPVMAGLNTAVRWAGGASISLLRGRRVRLVFRFQAARLFAFQLMP